MFDPRPGVRDGPQVDDLALYESCNSTSLTVKFVQVTFNVALSMDIDQAHT